MEVPPFPEHLLITGENLAVFWWLRRYAEILTTHDANYSFDQALMVAVASMDGPSPAALDPTIAWNSHVSICDISCFMFGASLLLKESNYLALNTDCIRRLMANQDASSDLIMVVSCTDYVTSAPSWFGSLHVYSKFVITGCVAMVKTIRARGSHPESDGTIFPTPPGLPHLAVIECAMQDWFGDVPDDNEVDDIDEDPAPAA